jgi:hypothetical protein
MESKCLGFLLIHPGGQNFAHPEYSTVFPVCCVAYY